MREIFSRVLSAKICGFVILYGAPYIYTKGLIDSINLRKYKVYELEGGNLPVESIRFILQEYVSIKVTVRMIFIIYNAHMLSAIASNVFLKSLEEGNDNILFIMVTDNLSGLLPTVKSRGLIFNVAKKIDHSVVNDILKTHAKTQGNAHKAISLDLMLERILGEMDMWKSIFSKPTCSTEELIEELDALDVSMLTSNILKKGDVWKIFIKKVANCMIMLTGIPFHVKTKFLHEITPLCNAIEHNVNHLSYIAKNAFVRTCNSYIAENKLCNLN